MSRDAAHHPGVGIVHFANELTRAPGAYARAREVTAARRSGAAIDPRHDVLVEQRADAVLPVADRMAFVENGRVTGLESAADLAKDRALIDRYVGI